MESESKQKAASRSLDSEVPSNRVARARVKVDPFVRRCGGYGVAEGDVTVIDASVGFVDERIDGQSQHGAPHRPTRADYGL